MLDGTFITSLTGLRFFLPPATVLIYLVLEDNSIYHTLKFSIRLKRNQAKISSLESQVEQLTEEVSRLRSEAGIKNTHGMDPRKEEVEAFFTC